MQRQLKANVLPGRGFNQTNSQWAFSTDTFVLYAMGLLFPFASIVSHMITAVFGLIIATILVLPVLLKGAVPYRKELIPPIVLLIWMGVSMSWTYDTQRALQAFVLVFSVQAALFLFSAPRSTERSIKLFIGVAIISALALIFICLFVMLTVGTLRPTGVRAHWVGPISTRAAAEAALLVPVMAYLIQRKGPSMTPFVILISLIVVGILTQSRSGIGTVAISLGLSFLVLYKNSIGRIGVILCSAPIVVFFLLFAYWLMQAAGIKLEAVERLLNTDFAALLSGGGGSVGDRSLTEDWGRLVMYTVGLDLIDNFSLQGAGFFSVGPIAYDQFGHFVQSHNIIITIFGELGLIGGAFGTIYLVTLWRCWWRLKAHHLGNAETEAFVKLLGLIILIGLFLAQFKTMQGNLILFGAIGIMFSMTNQVQREKN